jgi:hypothetical protein
VFLFRSTFRGTPTAYLGCIHWFFVHTFFGEFSFSSASFIGSPPLAYRLVCFFILIIVKDSRFLLLFSHGFLEFKKIYFSRHFTFSNFFY